MSWILLLIAGVLEAGWLVGIQKSESFTKIPFVFMAVVSMALSLLLFSMAIKTIPVSYAYLIWIAVGVTSISVVNHYFFGQSLSLKQLFFFALIMVGVMGLKLTN